MTKRRNPAARNLRDPMFGQRVVPRLQTLLGIGRSTAQERPMPDTCRKGKCPALTVDVPPKGGHRTFEIGGSSMEDVGGNMKNNQHFSGGQHDSEQE
jgi:hypothetical protein